MDKEITYGRLTQNNALFNAWKMVKKKGSTGGIDRISIQDFEANEAEFLDKITQQIKDKTYSPEPYLKIAIPKNETEKRELGMLTIQDKIIQTAIKSIIEPVFEKSFLNNSYGYREGKGAVKAIHRLQHEQNNSGASWSLSMDIDGFFDNIDHDLLFKKLSLLIRIKICNN